ncbi:MAG TPA: DUF4129 domain-containing protein [Solirubrobacteraceae bacterium]|nr:DUF4129 domain-containing protein [Solirubrobacteraceae bacterium]
MASAADGASAAAALARGHARAILAESRFHAAPVPRPLHGALHTLGRALEAPLQAIEELVASVAPGVPGGSATVWGALAAALLALGALLATRGVRRALRDAPSARPSARPPRASDLEREASTAERQGRHADAVRLRFRAGLMRLAELGRVQDAPSMLNGELARALRSERFDVLARRFEEIAYGGRPAAAEDAEASAREWRALLASRERR